MFATARPPSQAPAGLYPELLALARALFAGERDAIANSANLASLVFHSLPELNWAGFYWLRGRELVLGPFQGKPACIRIALGAGVCGTAAAQAKSIVVPDVNAFAGHIACDSASRSELVVPVIAPAGDHGGPRVLGVFDLDSPRAGRFTEEDARGLEPVVRAFVDATDLA